MEDGVTASYVHCRSDAAASNRGRDRQRSYQFAAAVTQGLATQVPGPPPRRNGARFRVP